MAEPTNPEETLQGILILPEDEPAAELATMEGQAEILGMDETVMAQWPGGPLDDRQPSKGTRLVYRVGGAEWEVIPAAKFGFPTSVEDDVWMAVLSFSVEQGLRQTVQVTYRELLERLGWDDSGARRKRLSLALDRLKWSGVRITGAYSHVAADAPFVDLSRLGARAEVGEGGARAVSLVIDGTVWASMRSGKALPTSYTTYRSLGLDAAKRLYRLLDSLRHERGRGSTVVTFDLRELCHERLAMNRAFTAPSKLRRTLDPAHAELVRVGLLKANPVYRAARGKTTVTYTIGHADREYGRLVDLLTDRGVSSAKAAELVDGHRRSVERHVAAYDRSPVAETVGWLIEAIEKDWTHREVLPTRRPRAPRHEDQVALPLGESERKPSLVELIAPYEPQAKRELEAWAAETGRLFGAKDIEGRAEELYRADVATLRARPTAQPAVADDPIQNLAKLKRMRA